MNGAPTSHPLLFGAFDATGLWARSGSVPPGLSGNVTSFETLGFDPTGKVSASNEVVVTFQ